MSASPKILPFWGRLAVAPSPVDETQTDSGLIVPDRFDGDAGVRRGVVLSVDRVRSEETESMEDLDAGTVVWYRNGVKVRVQRSDILAYETDG